MLSACECCGDCIDGALASLQEIRRTLVERQVESSDTLDGPLSLLLDAITMGIRQFLTYEELLKRGHELHILTFGDFRRPADTRQAYFDGLEILWNHISRRLGQVAVRAGTETPTTGLIANYQGPGQLEADVAERPS